MHYKINIEGMHFIKTRGQWHQAGHLRVRGSNLSGSIQATFDPRLPKNNKLFPFKKCAFNEKNLQLAALKNIKKTIF